MVNLKKICQSPINLKIIAFFYEHPQTIDTSSGIAAWLSLERPRLKKALDYLVCRNILIPHRTGQTTAYAFTQDKGMIKEIKKILGKKNNKGERYV